MRSGPTPIRKRASGFTLVDLLLAMVIIGVSLGAIYGVFHAGLAAWNKGTDESILAYESTFLLDTMARDIRGAVLARPSNDRDTGEVSPVFDGTADSVEFFSGAGRPSQVQWPDHRLKYYFEKNKDAEWGVIRVKDMPSAGSVALIAKTGDEVLVERVSKFGLRFLNEGDWTDTWKNNGKLPEAVEISVEMGSDDGRLKRAFKLTVDIPAWRAAET